MPELQVIQICTMIIIEIYTVYYIFSGGDSKGPVTAMGASPVLSFEGAGIQTI